MHRFARSEGMSIAAETKQDKRNKLTTETIQNVIYECACRERSGVTRAKANR